MNIITRSGSLIVSDSEIKANSRITTTTEDSLVTLWNSIAHEYCESYSGLILKQATVEQVFNTKELDLYAPVRGIVSVKCYDDDQTETTVTDYDYRKTHNYGLALTLPSKPENYAVVRYVAGFGEFTATTETAINEGTITAYNQLKSAILLLTNHFYENRGIVTDFQKYTLPIGVHAILDQVVNYR